MLSIATRPERIRSTDSGTEFQTPAKWPCCLRSIMRSISPSISLRVIAPTSANSISRAASAASAMSKIPIVGAFTMPTRPRHCGSRSHPQLSLSYGMPRPTTRAS